MGISLSKPPNPLVQENFDGESSDYKIAADNYTTPFGPEWIFTNSHLDQLKKELPELNHIPDDVPLFSLENRITVAKCIKVYDGDTPHVVFKYDGQLIRYRCRMISYNSEELRSPDPQEKKKAYAARDYLADRLLDKKVIIRFGSYDKYGRPLIDVYLIEDEANLTIDNAFEVHINKEMIDKGYGKPYLG